VFQFPKSRIEISKNELVWNLEHPWPLIIGN
jgi:hypothetical protein